MITRAITQSVANSLENNAVVIISGPRRAGKTTFAVEFAKAQSATYLDMAKFADRTVAAERLNPAQLVVVDHAEMQPDIVGAIRAAGTQVVLVGQQSLGAEGQGAHHQLGPLTLIEAGPEAITDLWLRGGYPESFFAVDEAASFRAREDLIRDHVERSKNIPDLHQILTRLAQTQDAPFNGAALGVSGPAASRYLDALMDGMLVRRLDPWPVDNGKRLVKSPKIYLGDTGILHALWGVATGQGLLAHPMAEASWKAFCVAQLLAQAPEGAQVGFYKTSAGAELDLVLKGTDGAIWAVEIRLSTAVGVSRGFHRAADDVNADHRVLIYAGDETKKGQGGVIAMPLHLLTFDDLPS